MTDRGKELGQQVMREKRQRFVREVAALATTALPLADQARVLRAAADQIERAAAGNPVQRSQARVAERDEFPNRGFFQPKPAKPSPEMRDRWLAEDKQRRQLKRLPAHDRDRDPEPER